MRNLNIKAYTFLLFKNKSMTKFDYLREIFLEKEIVKRKVNFMFNSRQFFFTTHLLGKKKSIRRELWLNCNWQPRLHDLRFSLIYIH